MSENSTSSPLKQASLRQITTIDHLDAVDKCSFEQPVYLFKHSTRCGISFAAKEDVEQFAEDHPHLDVHLVDLLRYRDISDSITGRYGRPHQSPQVLVIQEGNAIHQASHFGIDYQWLVKASITIR